MEFLLLHLRCHYLPGRLYRRYRPDRNSVPINREEAPVSLQSVKNSIRLTRNDHPANVALSGCRQYSSVPYTESLINMVHLLEKIGFIQSLKSSQPPRQRSKFIPDSKFSFPASLTLSITYPAGGGSYSRYAKFYL